MTEGADRLRARVERVEQLCQDQRGEDRCTGGVQVVGGQGSLDEAAGQEEVQRRQGRDGHDGADQQDAAPHGAVDHPVGGLARWAGHDVLHGGVHAHGQGRSGVGDQVDPQDLGGQQRQDHAGLAVPAQADDSREHHAAEDREDLTHVGGQQEAQELLDVVEDAPALTHGVDDGGEVVVRQDHRGGLLGHLGSGDAHGHADVRSAQGRGVVDAVAGHGDRVALRLQGVDDPHLVLRGDARVHAGGGYGPGQGLVVHRLQLPAGEDRGAPFDDAQVRCDASGGGRVVAGDHEDAHARPVRLGHGHGRLGARRVDDADDAGQYQIPLQVRQVRLAVAGGGLAHAGGLLIGEDPVADPQGAQRPARHVRDALGEPGPGLTGQLGGGLAQAHLRAVLHEDIRGALGDDDRAVLGVGEQHRHHLALGGEGDLADALEAALALAIGAELPLRDQEGALGRVADDAPHVLVGAELGVGGQRPAGEDHGDLVAQGPFEGIGVGATVTISVGGDLAVGRVPDAGDHAGARGRDDFLDRHLRASEGTGLVRADD